MSSPGSGPSGAGRRLDGGQRVQQSRESAGTNVGQRGARTTAVVPNTSGGPASTRRVEQPDEDRIGDYCIGEEIGRGSFATVFKGARHDTHALVAVKSVIRSKLTSKLLENLESEISILKRITHRNIVELKDCLKTDTHIYLIMAFCSAGDLSIYIRTRGDVVALTDSHQGLVPDSRRTDVLRGRVLYPHPKEGGLNETIVRCFLGQLVDALQFLRSQNVIHRDIKPQNLLLQPAEAADLAAGHPPGIPVLKVADFGFARWLPSQSLAETLCGSPLYMAPEILRYEKYDAKADLWSVGAVLFEMSVGKPPFRAQNHVDLLRKIERGEDKIKFPDDKKAEDGSDRVSIKLGLDIKALIRRLLKRNPLERMSFEDFFREARWVAQGGPAEGLTPAEQVSAQYARLNHSPASPNPVSAPSSSLSLDTPRSPLFIPTEAAFISPSSLATAAAAAAAATAVASSPIPLALPPPSSRLPAYLDQERPPFARRLSSELPLSPPIPRASSVSNRVVVDTGSRNDVKARDFAITTIVRRASGSPVISGTSSRSLTPTDKQGSSIVRASASGSMSDDGSLLGRDYVVVEKRTVEINALADELASMPSRGTTVATRRPSRGFLSRPASSLGVIAAATATPSTTAPMSIVSSSSPPTPYPPPSNSPYDLTSPAAFVIPPQRSGSSPHPYSLASSPRPLSYLSSSPRSQSSYLERFPGSPLALVGSPSAALAKALNMASLKIFGSAADGILLRRNSTRKPITRSSPAVDPLEDQVLAELEDVAQKAQVLSDFADSKIVQILPPTPQTSSPTSLGTPSYFSHVAAREQATAAAANPFSPVPTPSPPPMRRTSSSSSDRPLYVLASSVRAEILAAESMVLYLKALTFLGRGIEVARRHWANRPEEQNASADFNEAVQWFRQRFNECFDKAEFAKSRSQDDIPESASMAEKLIYDRALEISRAAAVNELRGESPADCEAAYETALWLLYALLDESMTAQRGEPVDDADRSMVNKVIASITTRLQALRQKIAA